MLRRLLSVWSPLDALGGLGFVSALALSAWIDAQVARWLCGLWRN